MFSRQQLLSDVWGYDYYGGTAPSTCTYAAAAKLGPEYESVIGTVRNVGLPLRRADRRPARASAPDRPSVLLTLDRLCMWAVAPLADALADVLHAPDCAASTAAS